MFHPPPAVADVCGLWRRACSRHCRRSIPFVIRHRLHASTSLRPLAPRALPRFIATTDALTPAGRLFGLLGHEHRSGPSGSPCLARPHFPPFRPQPPRRPSPSICARSRFLSAGGRKPENPARRQRDTLPHGSWPGLRTALAGSPVGAAESGSRCVMSVMSRCYGRVVHLRQLPTPCCHDAVAFGYRPVNVRPDGDLHPAMWTSSQAHECGSFDAGLAWAWRGSGRLRRGRAGGCFGGCLKIKLGGSPTQGGAALALGWPTAAPLGRPKDREHRPLAGRFRRPAETIAPTPADHGTALHLDNRQPLPSGLWSAAALTPVSILSPQASRSTERSADCQSAMGSRAPARSALRALARAALGQSLAALPQHRKSAEWHFALQVFGGPPTDQTGRFRSRGRVSGIKSGTALPRRRCGYPGLLAQRPDGVCHSGLFACFAGLPVRRQVGKVRL